MVHFFSPMTELRLQSQVHFTTQLNPIELIFTVEVISRLMIQVGLVVFVFNLSFDKFNSVNQTIEVWNLLCKTQGILDLNKSIFAQMPVLFKKYN